MQKILLTFIAFLLFISAFGQNKDADRVVIIKDNFRGVIPETGQNISILLTLKHVPYADDGDFTLKESFFDPNKREHTINSFGEWTVLRGDAKDENATVVELDAPARILYFLRLKDGSLQMLDTSLREIKPAAKYILHKDNGLLSGTYKGSRPLTGCSVETTLKLDCIAPCHEGSYTLYNKYIGTPKGTAKSSLADSAKGKWEIPARRGLTDTTKTIIVLDPGKSGPSPMYLLTEDGNLLPIGTDLKPAAGLFDGTLEKK